MSDRAALAPSSHLGGSVTSRRDRWRAGGVAIAAAMLALACTDPGTMPRDDGGSGDAWPPGVPGTVELLPSMTEGPGVPVDLLALRIGSIRLVGDRGSEFDPEIEDVGLVTVGDTTSLDIPIGDVPPALYSAVVVNLDDAAGEEGLPVFEMRFAPLSGPPLDVSTHEPLTLIARCEHGAVVNTTDAVRIGVDLAVGYPANSLLLFPLPAPDASGVVHVNEETAPEAIAAFRHELAEHVHAECGPDRT